MLKNIYMSSCDGFKINVNANKVAIVVMVENPSGAVYMFDASDVKDEDLDLEVDKYMKNIGQGTMVQPYCYKFVKRVENVFFYL